MEFAPEPTANNIHRCPTTGELIQGGEVFRRKRRIPRTGQNSHDELQPFGGSQKRVAKEHGLMLILSAVARSKTDLTQSIVEPAVFRGLRQFSVIIDVPASALLDIADNQTTADIGHPI